MQLERLSIINYRNIESAELELSPGISCMVGPNGAGKTNILDTIYYLSFCKSLTGLPDSLNIRHNEPFFVIQGTYNLSAAPQSDGNAAANEETAPTPQARDEIYCGVKRGQKKQFKRNKKEYQRLTDHIGLLPLVLMSPADEDLINESAEARRRYADSIISQSDHPYMEALMAYNRLITQRNTLLKHMADQPNADLTLLEVFDQQLAHYGTRISQRRRAFVEWLRPVVTELYGLISGMETSGTEGVTMTYVTGLDRYDLYDGLRDSRQRDLALGYTSRGIHKDDIDFSMGGYPLKKVGSQGQRKSFVIALKLAQYRYLTETLGTRPILLLDDVFDKLDAARGDNLIGLVASGNFDQIVITDTDMARLQRVLDKADKAFSIFTVQNGCPTLTAKG